MCEQYQVVPWYNTAEWNYVYNAIFTENCNKQDALNLLVVWKARSPSLPSGIESTLSLLQVHVQDENSNNDIADDQILRLAYSSAVMRFVNHMLDSEISRGVSLYQAAKSLGVPDWVIDLRHDTAHSNNLPSLILLRNACEISLEWLHKNYWNEHKECIQDYTSGQKDSENNDDGKINSIIYFYSCLSICKHCKIKKLSDIPDSMQESLLSDATDLLGNYMELSNLESVTVGSLINSMDFHAKKHLKAKNTVLFVNRALLGEESLFLSLDLVDFLSRNEFKKKKLSRRYVHCFEILLTFLHTHDLLVEFVIALIEMTQNCECAKKTLLAALWVSEILSSMRKSKQFLSRATQLVAEDSSSNKKKDLKQMYYHWFPNERSTGLILDLHKAVPTKLTDINFLQPIISSYNPYLTFFVNDLLLLVEPKIPHEVSSKICKLAKLISAPEKFPVEMVPMKIYTAADLKAADCAYGLNDSDELKECSMPIDVDSEEYITSIWKIASKNRSWSSCPVGQVPSDIGIN